MIGYSLLTYTRFYVADDDIMVEISMVETDSICG